MNITLDEVEAYAEIVEQLKDLKDCEMRVRKELAEKIKTLAIKSGSANVGDKKFILETDDFSIKFTPGINRSLDQDGVESNYSEMTSAEKDCLKQVFKLSEAAFKKLRDLVESEDYEGERDLLLFECVTEKPGAPTLDIEIF